MDFENELSKVKIHVPLIELMKIPSFRDPAYRMLKTKSNETPSDVINLHDEHSTSFVSSSSPDKVEKKSYFPPPFYITLMVHEKMLHNCLLESIASHSLMPKVVMEALGLSINRPHHDLFAFDSREVKCLGLIKDLVVNLA